MHVVSICSVQLLVKNYKTVHLLEVVLSVFLDLLRVCCLAGNIGDDCGCSGVTFAVCVLGRLGLAAGCCG